MQRKATGIIITRRFIWGPTVHRAYREFFFILVMNDAWRIKQRGWTLPFDNRTAEKEHLKEKVPESVSCEKPCYREKKRHFRCRLLEFSKSAREDTHTHRERDTLHSMIRSIWLWTLYLGRPTQALWKIGLAVLLTSNTPRGVASSWLPKASTPCDPGYTPSL